MRMRTCETVLLLFLLACSRRQAKKATPGDAGITGAAVVAQAHTDEPEHEALARRVRLSAEVIRAVGITTRPVSRGRLIVTHDVPGETVADPDRTAQVAARIAGRIERIAFREGDRVKAGEVLTVVRAPELGELRSAYVSSAARSAAAQENAVRLSALLQDRLAAGQEVLAAQAEARALSAAAQAAGERLRALGLGLPSGALPAGAVSLLELRAPIGGTLIQRHAVLGQPVTPEQVLATIADLDEVWFLARVFEHNLVQVRAGARAEVQLNAYPSDRFEGRIEHISDQIDPAARTLVARIRLVNRDRLLRIGLFGMARIESGGEKNAAPTLIVPRGAVTEIAGKQVVFVRQQDDDFELHEVALGESSLGQVAVLGGLREGEQVVTEGVFTLKSAVLKGMLAEED